MKITRVVDMNGRELGRKVKRDDGGLYILHKGMKAYLSKKIIEVKCPDMIIKIVTRKVAYYVTK